MPCPLRPTLSIDWRRVSLERRGTRISSGNQVSVSQSRADTSILNQIRWNSLTTGRAFHSACRNVTEEEIGFSSAIAAYCIFISTRGNVFSFYTQVFKYVEIKIRETMGLYWDYNRLRNKYKYNNLLKFQWSWNIFLILKILYL